MVTAEWVQPHRARAREPKELSTIDGANYIDLYDTPQYVPQVLAKLTAFYPKHLYAARPNSRTVTSMKVLIVGSTGSIGRLLRPARRAWHFQSSVNCCSNTSRCDHPAGLAAPSLAHPLVQRLGRADPELRRDRGDRRPLRRVTPFDSATRRTARCRSSAGHCPDDLP